MQVGAPAKVIMEISSLNLSRKSATLPARGLVPGIWCRLLVKEDVVIEGEACVLVSSRP
jgi:hypothetical protein